MILAGLFAGALFLGLLIGDRLYFRTLSLEASRYGCRVGRGEHRLESLTPAQIQARFDALGILALHNGVARLFADAQRILVRPRYPTLWAFLWIWPMKVTIDLRTEGGAVVLSSTKRMPWCSAILTGAWFAIVGIGTIATLISYGIEGGLSSSGGVLMGAGIFTLGAFFFFSGLVTVVMAYRMENSRLARVSQELVEALTGTAAASSATR
ncbi:MAG: hypothetical protein RI101_13745 [Nitrospira sp.]|jgi:hypothetical protein|nr:hypothetical protein [Nitrospira sp.]